MSETIQCEVAVLGGGPGGYTAALDIKSERLEIKDVTPQSLGQAVCAVLDRVLT